MVHGVTRVEWAVPVTLHVALDAVDPRGFQLRGSHHDEVQLLVGSAVRVRLWQPDAAAPVLAQPGSVVESVTAAELVAADHAQETPAELPDIENDDTILRPIGVRAESGPPAVPRTRGENDVADTILGRSAVEDEAASDTIVGGFRPRARAVKITEARHAVRLPDGRVVPLDRIVYVGRSPRSPRITSGTVPGLVTVPSPLREISGTHLEIEVQGGVVVVRDLGSTNGTSVTMPGAMRSLLRPGDSRVVGVGTLLDLGDSVVLEIVPNSPAGTSW